MKKLNLKVVISRSLIVAAACAALYFGYSLVGIFFSPVPVPPVMPAKRSVTFDAALDVSKKTTFEQLRSLGPVNVSTTNLGRDNPFMPLPTSSQAVEVQPTMVGATSTNSTAPTSTAATSSSTTATVSSAAATPSSTKIVTTSTAP